MLLLPPIEQFCWVEYGFQSARSLIKKGGIAAKEHIDGRDGARWNAVLDLFSKLDELNADC